jgi:DNA polymerase-3 subunit epsilon
MKRLYFDTETTGFPAKAGTHIDRCPSIVQLAAILVDDELGEMASVNQIIRPLNWTVPDEVAAVHGITTSKAMAFGVPIRSAMSVFAQMTRLADQVVAHNINFDLKFLAYEFDRIGNGNVIADKPGFCTMEATTDICKIPGRWPGKFKWPKLMEAHIFLLGGGFDDAHDALADVRACHRIHRHLIDNQLI